MQVGTIDCTLMLHVKHTSWRSTHNFDFFFRANINLGITESTDTVFSDCSLVQISERSFLVTGVVQVISGIISFIIAQLGDSFMSSIFGSGFPLIKFS